MHLYIFLLLNFFFLVLKAVENIGVSHVKGHEPYQNKLEAEIRKLKFSYRVSKRGNKCHLVLYIHVLSLSCGKVLVLGTRPS